MKFLRYVLILCVASLCVSGSVFAAKKIYPLGLSGYGIVADDNEWTCVISNKDSELLHSYCYGNISGKSKSLPIQFDFFLRQINTYGYSAKNLYSQKALDESISFLSNYSCRFGTVFSGIFIKDLEEDDCFLITGSYFDNNSVGNFAFYIHKDIYKSYCMFIKIQGTLLDDRTLQYLFDETFRLSTPLILK